MLTVNYLRLLVIERNIMQQRKQNWIKAIEKITEAAREAYEVLLYINQLETPSEDDK